MARIPGIYGIISFWTRSNAHQSQIDMFSAKWIMSTITAYYLRKTIEMLGENENLKNFKWVFKQSTCLLQVKRTNSRNNRKETKTNYASTMHKHHMVTVRRNTVTGIIPSLFIGAVISSPSTRFAKMRTKWVRSHCLELWYAHALCLTTSASLFRLFRLFRCFFVDCSAYRHFEHSPARLCSCQHKLEYRLSIVKCVRGIERF